MQTKEEIKEIFELYFITKITGYGMRARVRKEILKKGILSEDVTLREFIKVVMIPHKDEKVNQELWEWFEKSNGDLDKPINKILAGNLDSLARNLAGDEISVKNPEEI